MPSKMPGSPTLRRSPQRRVHPALIAKVRSSSRPLYILATVAGCLHYPKFSELINSETVPDTPTTVTRLQRLARAVGHPLDAIFVAEESADGE